jgi:Trk-type K+ transport system membrane component
MQAKFIYRAVFECVSAFAGIGLSLGTPTTAFSLSGDFRKLSKLVICVLMVRGRLRGLPIAIDRAILLVSGIEASKVVA